MDIHTLLTLSLILSLFSFTGGNQSPQWNNFPSTLLVSEDATVGSVVTILNATDPDDGDLQYEVKGGLGGEVLAISILNTSEALVTLAKTLDREAVEEYSLLFTVTDGVNMVQRWCTLYVLDINDNRPRFLNVPYHAKVSETTKVGAEIFRVSADDPDTGVWSLVSFALKSKTPHFGVHTARGTVVLTKELDYSEQRFFQLEILAIDGGGLSSSVTLEVDVFQSASLNGSKGLRCYSCIHSADCDMRQLSYSPKVKCPPGYLCYMTAIEDPWLDFRYRRGCQDVSRCAGAAERCVKTQYGRYQCFRCCDQNGCNKNLFRPHVLREAQEVLDQVESVQYSGEKTQVFPNLFLIGFSVLCIISRRTLIW